jgi:tRNA-specific 2-thiouridylase
MAAKPINQTKVVVGLSGGVDSSVTAYLLKEQGYQVIGLFMKNWHDDSVTISDECPWLEDSNDALIVADKLGIPFQTVDLSDTYRKRIVDYMFAEYKAGRTPNPDVLCNREIKFDVFLTIALSLGADYVATGHYCQKGVVQRDDKEIYQLLKGADPSKDQSYFLCQLNQDQLAKAMFPIGHLQKSEVREIAKKADLITAEKRDSQGLCFIGKVRLPDFLQQQLKPKEGEIIEISSDHSVYQSNPSDALEDLSRPFKYQPEMGKVLAKHNGAHYFTIGQRKGLAVGGTELPLFVIGVDTDRNVLYVGQGSDHPGLYRSALKIQKDKVHWVRPDLAGDLRVQARIRYRQPLQQASIIVKDDATYVKFDQPQSAITPGQFVAWYIENELVGSGVISE